MHKALLQAAPCLCIHIERHVQTDQNELQTSDCRFDLASEIAFPVFYDNSMKMTTAGYTPVAGLFHLGSDCAGHYRAALCMQPTVIDAFGAADWLLTEDGAPPAPVWKLPLWCQKSLTVVWLVRTDCVQLPTYPAAAHAKIADTETSTAGPADTNAALLQLLHAQKPVAET